MDKGGGGWQVRVKLLTGKKRKDSLSSLHLRLLSMFLEPFLHVGL